MVSALVASALLQTRDPINLQLKALQCADTDGGRRTPVTGGEIQAMVDLANRVYAASGIHLVFDPTTDIVQVKDTVLNSLGSAGDPGRVLGAASSVEDEHRRVWVYNKKYPGHLLVIFLYGGSRAGPVGGGYSGSDQSCVVMPAPSATNMGVRGFAHEFGHFCFLNHTFGPQLRTREAAARFLAENGRDLSKFDGDGLSDTPPDPGIDLPVNSAITSMTLSGVTFRIPNGNIMSYMGWDEHEWLSPEQARLARDFLQMRLRLGIELPTNQVPEAVIEAEQMAWTLESGAWGYRQSMEGFGRARWSDNTQVAGGGPAGSSMAFRFVTPRAEGRLEAFVTKAPMYGVIQFELDGKVIGTEYDSYEPGVVASGAVPLGRVNLSPGAHTLRIRAVRKNPRATSDNYGLDCIRVVALQ